MVAVFDVRELLGLADVTDVGVERRCRYPCACCNSMMVAMFCLQLATVVPIIGRTSPNRSHCRQLGTPRCGRPWQLPAPRGGKMEPVYQLGSTGTVVS